VSAANVGPKAGPKTDGPKQARVSSASPTLRLALVFALLLLALGVAAGASVSLLVRAIAGPPPVTQPSGSAGGTPVVEDIGNQVCDAYVTQKYDALVRLIDPAPVPRTAAGTFNAAAQAALEAELKARDNSPGKVTKCTSSGPTPGTGAAEGKSIFKLVMTRTLDQKVTNFTQTIIAIKQADGSFKIERDSDFLGIPAPTT
jgi:hypothetical protein